MVSRLPGCTSYPPIDTCALAPSSQTPWLQFVLLPIDVAITWHCIRISWRAWKSGSQSQAYSGSRGASLTAGMIIAAWIVTAIGTALAFLQLAILSIPGWCTAQLLYVPTPQSAQCPLVGTIGFIYAGTHSICMSHLGSPQIDEVSRACHPN